MSTNHGRGNFGKAHLAGWIPSISVVDAPFDPSSTSAVALQQLLIDGRTTSVQAVQHYYGHILKYNGYLKAIYQLSPTALERAAELDTRRDEGHYLGPLHGIPVLLKDNVGTSADLGMDTTAGSLALVGSTTKSNAPIVDRLLSAGAIILGKTTLSELMWFKGFGLRCGWSALHGQSPNPYIEGGIDWSDGLGGHSSPGGSSSGSGIAVAAGFAPLAIGTDTEGSIISPATRQSLYALKPAFGRVPSQGVVPVSYKLDVAGPLCTCATDVLDTFLALLGQDAPKPDPYASSMKGMDGWKQLRIGTLDPEKFRYDQGLQTPVPEAIQQIHDATMQAYRLIQSSTQVYHYDVSLRLDAEFEVDGSNSLIELMTADFDSDFNQYLEGVHGAEVASTKDLCQWNKAHSDLELPPEYPGQEFIEKSLAFDHSSGRREKLMTNITEVSKSFDETLSKYGIDIIIGPADSLYSKYSAATGYPSCALPIGYIEYKGRPIGLNAMAKKEETLFTLMSAFEATFPPRKAPTAYLSQENVE